MKSMLAAFPLLLCGCDVMEDLVSQAGIPAQREDAVCSATTRAELEVYALGDTYEVEFDLESGVAGQRWAVEMWHNGDFVAAEERTTAGEDGDFWIEREVPDLEGVDTFDVTARNLDTGETCTVSATADPSAGSPEPEPEPSEDPPDQSVSDGCSAGTRAALDLYREPDGDLEVEFEIESGISGQEWSVELRQNGLLVEALSRTTYGADGEFWVEFAVEDLPGTDLFEVAAENLVSGETCALSAEWAG